MTDHRYTVVYVPSADWWTIRDTATTSRWIGQFALMESALAKAAHLNEYGERYTVPHPPTDGSSREHIRDYDRFHARMGYGIR